MSLINIDNFPDLTQPISASQVNEPKHVELGSNKDKGINRNLHTMRLPLTKCSEYAMNAIYNSPRKNIPGIFDLVCTGGGLMAYYGGAVSSVLGHLQRKGVLQVDKLYGVSCGALVCCCYLACESNYMRLECVYRCQQLFVQGKWLSQSMRKFLDEVLPFDIHHKANKRLHITVYEFSSRYCFPRKRVINEYKTKDELLDAAMASTIIPGITSANMYETEDGCKWMDGVQVSVPSQTKDRPQLYIDLMKIRSTLKYPILNIIRTIDENFDVNLCINGLKDIVNLLGENENMKSKGIYFIYNNDLK